MPLDERWDDPALAQIVAGWLASFEDALKSADRDALASLFQEDAAWRDVVAFTWDIQTTVGRSGIVDRLIETSGTIKPQNLHVPPDRASPRRASRAGVDCIEAIFTFETRHGQAAGVLRLIPADEQATSHRAWMLSTTLQDLSKHGIIEADHLAADAYSRDFGGENWLDKRTRRRAYADREPAVVVVGAGQAGLGVAARLSALGVDTLIIDRHERIGDNWRNRYHSLTLHNEAHVNHLPYIPFPITFPTFIPKDKLANWFEFYTDALDLNVWPGTELVSGTFDEATQTWSLRLNRPDGERVVKPRHVVLATGVSAIPIMPKLPGLDSFSGQVVHSGAYTDGADWSGKRALVIGTGNSAHDVAQDLEASGADTTMMQRASTYIVSLKQAQKVYALYEERISVEDCDLITTATSYDFLVRAYQLSTAEMKAVDQPLLDRLSARGFKLDFGEPDDTGFQMKYLRRGGGYYFNVGCSDLIADGKVSLIQFDDFERFVPEGALLKDGTTKPFDLIVAATGYKNQQETARAYLGDAVADRIGKVWGFDDGGELANMWKPTPQPGLWFTAGSLAQCRIYSRYLALQITAREAGIVAKGA